MRSKFAACLIAAATALGLATAAHAQTGASDDGLNCNQATADGGTLADDLNSTRSATQADSQYTDVGPRTGYRDTASTPKIAYRDQRCKVLDYIEKPLLQQEWQSIPPPPSPVIAAPPLTQSNDIDKGALKRGFGWCFYVNGTSKTAYYSDIYQGVPSQMALDPIVVANTLKVMSKNFEQAVQKLYPGEQGKAGCQFSQWDNKYVQEDQEKANEFHLMLENFKVVKTSWKPVITSTQ
jgi:hypothetical protein